MGWLIGACIVLYIICGFVFTLFAQVFASCHKNSSTMLACAGDTEGDTFFIAFLIIFWPAFVIGAILIDLIPWLLKKAYTGFVAIIFLGIALFKKEDGNGD